MGRKKKSAEEKVKKHLTQIQQIDGGWEALQNILWRRGVITMLKNGRKAQGLTQAQVAERMGVTQGQVAEIENDPWPDPYVSTLARYAHALGAEVHFEAVPFPEEPQEVEEDPSPPYVRCRSGQQRVCTHTYCQERQKAEAEDAEQ